MCGKSKAWGKHDGRVLNSGRDPVRVSEQLALQLSDQAPLRLRMLPEGGMRSIALAVAIGLPFGVYMAAIDAFVFRAGVPAAQTSVVAATSAIERIALYAPLALLDEILFRWVLMSAAVWLLTVVLSNPRRPTPNSRFWMAIIAVAAIYLPLHPFYLASLSFTPIVAAREVALHVAAGIVWGYLYWRHGLIASVAGHISAHVTLQPLLGYLGS